MRRQLGCIAALAAAFWVGTGDAAGAPGSAGPPLPRASLLGSGLEGRSAPRPMAGVRIRLERPGCGAATVARVDVLADAQARLRATVDALAVPAACRELDAIWFGDAPAAALADARLGDALQRDPSGVALRAGALPRPVPEPTPASLLGAGLLALVPLGGSRRRRPAAR